MKQLTLAGHPVHPQIVSAPVALLPFTTVMDVMYLVTRRRSYAHAAYYGLVGGVAGGLAAAATGVADYMTISLGGPMKRTANAHAVINVGVMALEAVSLALRKGKRSGVAPAILSGLGTLGVIVSSWYGGELVYKHGMRVEAATDRPQPQAKLPGDEAVERGFNRLAEMVPAGGPGKEE